VSVKLGLNQPSPHNPLESRIEMLEFIINQLTYIKALASEKRQGIIEDWCNRVQEFKNQYVILTLEKNSDPPMIQTNTSVTNLDEGVIKLISEKLNSLKASYAPEESPVLAKRLSHFFAWVKTFFGSSTLARARKLSLWAEPAFRSISREGQGVLHARPV